ncbi:acyl carrier protein [Aquitalea sp. LB_tupeE]|uniref:acyl carrier protein n=2 Tax=Chromobacteriaceae TaxID=1499392 RepID=UPI0015C10749|nr:acyl carrier protein [Aquitalea sp. LB_tupeE]NWK76866.1 acyl carrier protein [Aquitalea sp. LB_tupeE]
MAFDRKDNPKYSPDAGQCGQGNVMNTIEQIKQLIVEKFGVKAEEIQAERALSEYGLDSLGQIELLFAIEEHFSVSIPEEEAHVANLQELADLVDRYKSTAQ